MYSTALTALFATAIVSLGMIAVGYAAHLVHAWGCKRRIADEREKAAVLDAHAERYRALSAKRWAKRARDAKRRRG